MKLRALDFLFKTDFRCIFRLALLDDVYKQIRADNSSKKNVNVNVNANNTPPFRRIDGVPVASGDNEYEEGVASGYAIQHPIPSGFVPPQNHASNDIDYENYHRYAVAGNKAGLNIRHKLPIYAYRKYFCKSIIHSIFFTIYSQRFFLYFLFGIKIPCIAHAKLHIFTA